MAANVTELEKRFWDAADQLRANSDLKSHEYSVPVLGLIFLRRCGPQVLPRRRRNPPSKVSRCILTSLASS